MLAFVYMCSEDSDEYIFSVHSIITHYVFFFTIFHSFCLLYIYIYILVEFKRMCIVVLIHAHVDSNILDRTHGERGKERHHAPPF